ncbi:hypothetical protein [Streptomyces adustus]
MRAGIGTRAARPVLGAVLVASLVAAAGAGFPAYAGDGQVGGGTGTTDNTNTDSGADSGSGTIGAHIQIKQSKPGSGGDSTTATSSNANWKPPVCWYEPMYTSDEYEEFIKSAYNGAQEPAGELCQEAGRGEVPQGRRRPVVAGEVP